MKFFHINNALCTDCNRCAAGCPTGAVTGADGKRFIDPDKCTSCGSCIRNCSVGAVTVETVEHMALELEKVDIYRNRIRRLEKELAQTQERLGIVNQCFRLVILRLPTATFIVERGGRIVAANRAFAELTGIGPLRLADLPEDLAGENIFNLLPDEADKLIRMSASEDSDRCYVTRIGARDVSFSVTPLTGDYVLGIGRALDDPAVAGEQVLSLLHEVIDRKMAMVQKIGSLLGEETSAEINGLNTVIRIVESAKGTE